MKKVMMGIGFILIGFLLAACGGSEEENADASGKDTIRFGATSGPYSDMVTEAIAPLLEEKGYKVTNKEFTDYVQPNKALANGDLDANLFQHKIFLDSFKEEHDLELSEVIIVPTAPMGLYSNKYEDVQSIEEGSTLGVPNDPTNLARTLIVLEDEELITISEDVDPLRASLKDIEENPKNLEFVEVEAGQLPRLVDSEDLAAVPGNYALAAEMDLTNALALEDMPDDYRNRVAVKTEDLEKPFVKDMKEVIQSEEFEKIIDEKFKGFGKPAWMKEK
ncbi:ABC-type transport system extracellular binding protein (probable substrate methionine) [Halobacillus halophilus DSM 2266]|uniref:Lipoprotein n=1 Tax=Halobacillus halophilus (strain ATCC 35676 / DSM 2266 / JCM 20832 / KCTC 3685 / LMG 17431 / NBRC 102448 / NCIMB 2269) TaxID=866895 RepID=I0JNK9_HALH3|nr:MetQ/NlpA family ABC transporter substrate-binding protein [Halobacillus halophilus]CCG45729.1 ABC-type transport system extracellular binding protein (probable substrate methionine) [Halobacillus halophilus DSM 2266]